MRGKARIDSKGAEHSFLPALGCKALPFAKRQLIGKVAEKLMAHVE